MFVATGKNVWKIIRVCASSPHKCPAHKSQLILAKRLPSVCMYAWTPMEVEATRLKGMSGLCTSTTTKPHKKAWRNEKKDKIGESAFSQTADVKSSF